MDTAEDFKTLVNQLELLIVVHHKQSALPNSPTDPTPAFLVEMETFLIRGIRPLLPSQETDLCVHHNAKSWTDATIKTLKEHYNRLKDRAVETIASLMVPDWDRAFLVATRRARRNHAHVALPSLTTAYAILKDIMSPSFPSHNYDLSQTNQVIGRHRQNSVDPGRTTTHGPGGKTTGKRTTTD